MLGANGRKPLQCMVENKALFSFYFSRVFFCLFPLPQSGYMPIAQG